MENLEAKERIEIEFWKAAADQDRGARSISNLTRVFNDSRAFIAKLVHFDSDFAGAGTILELGAGEGWASCFVKRRYPGSRVIASDISSHALESLPGWESLLEVQLDDSFTCRSYEIPMPDESVDLAWCYMAAHHFVAHRKTLRELHRVLRPGGAALYLHEPSCRPYIYRAAYNRVNRKRPDVPEDVLRYGEIMLVAGEVGFEAAVRSDPTPIGRMPLETVYYLALSRIGLLRSLLPCSMDYVFRKPAR